MVDLRIIYKEQLDYCTEIAKDIIKHNGSRAIMEYVSEFCILDYDYYDEDNAIFMDDTVRVCFGECCCYVDFDEDGKMNGEVFYANDEMSYINFEDFTYDGTMKFLDSVSKKQIYNNAMYADCYDERDGKEKGYIKYIPMEV